MRSGPLVQHSQTPTHTVTNRPSRYAQTFDYDHRFHAANAGDVLKHCVLLGWLDALLKGEEQWVLLDTHAGAGMFNLPAQGEWLQGIGRLDTSDLSAAPPLVQRYMKAVGDKRKPGRGGLYPGSPALSRKRLRSQDRLILCERAEAPYSKLAAHYKDDTSVTVIEGDGLTQLVDKAENLQNQRLAAVIDPPYVSKAEWTAVADAVVNAHRLRTDLCTFLWFPIKSLTRPRAVIAAFRKAGLPGVNVELVHTPLRLQRKRLNGSGIILLNPPDGFAATLAEPLLWLGQVLSTEGEWNMTTLVWRGAAAT